MAMRRWSRRGLLFEQDNLKSEYRREAECVFIFNFWTEVANIWSGATGGTQRNACAECDSEHISDKVRETKV